MASNSIKWHLDVREMPYLCIVKLQDYFLARRIYFVFLQIYFNFQISTIYIQQPKHLILYFFNFFHSLILYFFHSLIL